MELIPFEDEFSEEAEALAEICQERGKKKAKGKRLKPLFLDAPEPRRVWTLQAPPKRIEDFKVMKREGVVKVGRNEPCPCGSGKKYKKCCI